MQQLFTQLLDLKLILDSKQLLLIHRNTYNFGFHELSLISLLWSTSPCWIMKLKWIKKTTVKCFLFSTLSALSHTMFKHLQRRKWGGFFIKRQGHPSEVKWSHKKFQWEPAGMTNAACLVCPQLQGCTASSASWAASMSCSLAELPVWQTGCPHPCMPSTAPAHSCMRNAALQTSVSFRIENTLENIPGARGVQLMIQEMLQVSDKWKGQWQLPTARMQREEAQGLWQHLTK